MDLLVGWLRDRRRKKKKRKKKDGQEVQGTLHITDRRKAFLPQPIPLQLLSLPSLQQC